MIRLSMLAIAMASALTAHASPKISETSFIVVTDPASKPNATAFASMKAAASFARINSLSSLKGISVVKVDDKSQLKRAMSNIAAIPGMSVYPDHIVHALATPADPQYTNMWGLNSPYDFDINAPEAWDIQTGSSTVVVGVIDTGVDYNHPDLQDNLWVNPGEIAGNGIDDDNNGWVDDIYGIDTVNNDGDPYDDNEHGTHVAGTIGASANNSEGVVGVAWNTSIVSCKFLDSYGGGTESDAIVCLDYFLSLKNAGVNLIATNNSWGGGYFSQPLLDAIRAQADADILFIAAAGNESNNNDASPSYPASYDAENIVSVAAHDEFGAPASFTNYGPASVDISAPGVDILSTVPGGGYSQFSGTSMATPHVTGGIALLAAQYPDATSEQLKALLLNFAIQEENLNDIVGYGRMQLISADGTGSINCADELIVRSRQGTTIKVPLEEEFTLEFSAYNCVTPGEALELTDGSSVYSMTDDGVFPDQVAGDGIFSIAFNANWAGSRTYQVVNHTDVSTTVTTYDIPDLTETPYQYIDISGVATNLFLSDDSNTVIDPGFPVALPDGTTSQSLYISSNGLIGLEGSGSQSFSNQTLPTGIANQILYPYWTDLNPGSGGEVRYGVIGEAPERQLVIEYANVPHYANSEGLTFQIVLNESSPLININYLDVTAESGYSGGARATIGYEVSGNAVQYSYYQESLRDQMSLTLGDTGPNPAPVITEFRISSGVFRPEQLIGFIAQAIPSEETPEATVELTMSFNGGPMMPYSGGEEIFATFPAGVHSASLMAVSGEYSSSRTLTFTIENFSQEEIALMDAAFNNGTWAVINDPEAYGLFGAAQDAINAILQNPEEYNLTNIVNTPEALASMPRGKHLLGASVDITNMDEYFSSARYVITYRDGVNYGWSPYPSVRDAMVERGYTIITEIEAGMGFWLYK